MKADNNYLEHHGIKGMKWGVRRTKAQLGYKIGFRKKKKKSEERKDDNSSKQTKKTVTKKVTNKKKSKSVKDMSDEELRSKINRLEMERRYRDLSPKDISKGKKFTSRVINNMVLPAAEDVGRQLIKSAIAKVINDKVTTKMGSEYRVYTNNKKKN